MSSVVEVQIADEPRKRGFCWCGCGKPAPLSTKTDRTAKRIQGVASRFRVGHGGRPTDFSRYAIQPDGCWVWLGFVDDSGYGFLQHRGVSTTAHRAVWEFVHGVSVPTALQVDHLCYARSCVNPSHLEITTPRVNHERRRMKRLTRQQVEEIRKSPLTVSRAAIAFNVSAPTICDVRSGRTHTYDGEAERSELAARYNALPRVRQLPHSTALEEALAFERRSKRGAA